MLPASISTARLVLRQFRFADADDIFAYALDAEFARYLDTKRGGYTRRHAERWVAKAQLLDWSSEPHWAMEFNGAVVGGIALRISVEHAHAQLTYELARPRWNAGLTTEAARAVIDAAFDGLPNVRRVFAKADLRNVGSWRVMEKVGMRREGVVRGHRVHRGRPVDDAYYGLLRDEGQAVR